MQRKSLLLCSAFLIVFALSLFHDCIAQRCHAPANNQWGRCSTLSSCTALLEQMDGAALYMYSSSYSNYITSAICGFDGTQFLVCCPTSSPMQQAMVYQPLPPMPTTYSNTVGALSAIGFQFGPLSGISPAATSAPMQPPQPTWSPWITAPPQQQPQQPISPPQQSNGNTPVIFEPVPNYAPTPTIPQQLPQVPSTRATVPTYPPVTSNSCGRIAGTINRVVGGNEAKRGSYPWIAALAYNEGGSVQFLCAGSLISRTYVVTSAHCINSQLAYVRLGAHNLADANEAGATNVAIKRSMVHEQFDIRSVVNDIALIELATPAPQTQMIDIICLPEGATFLNQDFVGMNPFVAGWGATKYQGATATRLRDVQVPIVSRQTCENSYKSVFSYVQFNERIICAGNSNVDACQGDSGGPLMLPQLDGSSNYRFYLLGVVSYGYECARPGFPGVYTRVASFLPWLRQHMI